MVVGGLGRRRPLIVGQQQTLRINTRRWSRLAQAAAAQFSAEAQPLLERQAELARQLERLDSRALLAEERVIGKDDFASRKRRLEAERAAARDELQATAAEIVARGDRDVDVDTALRSRRHVSDVNSELDELA